jgi:hypothetical protein
MDILDHIQKEWNTLKGAPVAFAVLMLLAFIAAVLVMDWLHADRFSSIQQQVSTLNSTNDLLKLRVDAKDDQLNDYRARIVAADSGTKSGKTASHDAAVVRQRFNASTTRFSNASNAQLEKLGGKLASEILDLAKKAEEPLQSMQTSTDIFTRAVYEANFAYESKYQADAMVLRDEILSRLPLVHRAILNDAMYEHPTNPTGLEMVAADLGRLAKMLPQE